MSTPQREHIIIFEDDFVWTSNVDPTYLRYVINSVKVAFPDWKVILLSANLDYRASNSTGLTIHTSTNSTTEVLRVSRAQTTHAYVVKFEYIPVLKYTFESCDVLVKNVAIDQCWKELQVLDEWYGLSPQLGLQKSGYSDILNEEKVQTWTRKGPKII